MRALALAGLALAAACAPQQAGRPSAAGGPAPGGLEAQAARLPAEVAGFTRGNTVWHEPERPGFGVTVDYAAPARAAVATVNLYDRGQGAVAGAPGDPRLSSEFEIVIADVLALAGTRTQQRLAEQERSEAPVPGGAPLTCSRLEGTYGRQQMTELVCLGAAAGRFLRVQVTAPLRPVRPVDPLLFAVEIAQAARGA
ncbi:hypothetical protein [Falsiroseomonas sp.]|uniref:hypothetical protein n=1 Tax=Falsiroseomonas sp. TaxID=2870721 RepID=UPI0035681F61